MTSVIITGPNNLQETVIRELHSMRVIHIVEHSKNELADIGKPLESASRLSEILVKVRALSAELIMKKKEKKETTEFEHKKGLLEIEQAVKRLSEDLNANKEELKKTEELIAKNQSIRQELELLKGINVPLESFTNYKSLACFTGYLKDENRAVSLKVELSITTQKFMLFYSSIKKRCLIALFIDEKSRENAGYVLQRSGFSPVNFMSIGNFKGSASANLKKIEYELEKLENKKREIKKRIGNLSLEHGEFLFAAEQFLSEQLVKAEAPLMFAATATSFLIKGWVPSKILSATIERLNNATHNKAYIHFEPAKKTDNVPVKLKNPSYAKPFEFFMELYTMPNYKEIDPTFFVFLSFPLLFGFMLGDIGYGAVTLILFILLKKFLPKAKNLLNVLIFASLATMLFGFIFGEFFGYEKIGEFPLPHLLSRSHQISELLYAAVAVGFIHVNIGLSIGFINELRAHGIKHAFFAKISWFIFEAGFVMVFLPIFKLITLSYWWGIGVMIISAVMLFIGEGARGPIEIPGLLSNVLSYARLMAIGVSSVKLAEVVNEISGEMFRSGGALILAGLFILVIGHAVNIGLGLLGSFLHSLRLHYVEFFTKFFHGGAKRYNPFGAKNFHFE